MICNYLNQHGYEKRKGREFELKYFTRGLIVTLSIVRERIIKQIDFKFPVYYDGQEGYGFRLFNEKIVEVVCLMSRVEK